MSDIQCPQRPYTEMDVFTNEEAEAERGQSHHGYRWRGQDSNPGSLALNLGATLTPLLGLCTGT